LSELRGHVLLALEKSSDVALELDHFASDGFGGARADEASGERAGHKRGAENDNITNTHEQSS
jgi:hypothetical protein